MLLPGTERGGRKFVALPITTPADPRLIIDSLDVHQAMISFQQLRSGLLKRIRDKGSHGFVPLQSRACESRPTRRETRLSIGTEFQ